MEDEPEELSESEIIGGTYDVYLHGPSGVKYIVSNDGLMLSRKQVEELLAACQSHLENHTDKEIKEINNAWTKWEEEQDAIREENYRLDKLEKQKSSTFIYLMRNHRNGFTKIGISKNPQAREATLQAEEPEIEMIGFWPGFIEDEKELHEEFASVRKRGEWFALTEADIEAVKDYFSTSTAVDN